MLTQLLIPGSIVESKVTRLEQYGAWVECNGQKGLVVIPEVSWSRIGHPGEVLSIGEYVPVKILAVQPDGRFSALLKAVHPELDPWRDPTVFAAGMEFVGPVVRILEYGCFVELKPDVWGLLRRQQWPGPLAAGDRLRVRVESVDPQSRKIEVCCVQS